MPTLTYIKSRAIVAVENGKIIYNEEFNARLKALMERASRKAASNQHRSASVSGKTRTKRKGAKTE